MAKGDKKKMQTAVNTAVDTSRAATNKALNDNIIPTTNASSGYYNDAAQQQMGDYRALMDQFKNYQSTAPGPVSAERVSYNRSPEMNEAFGGYRNFMNTGGFSGDDIANMRARGISPIRSTYANMQNELERQKNLQGGYSPNMAAAMTRMRGSTSQQMADMVQQVNADLAEKIQRGKMFGTEGMGGLSVQDTQFGQNAQLANQRAGLDAASLNAQHPDMKLQAMMAASNLYGQQPGMVGTFGQMALGGQRNWLEGTGQIGDIGRTQITGQQGVSQTPSNFETGFGRLGQGLGMAGNIAGAFMGLPGGIRKPPVPSNRIPYAMNTYNQFPGYR